MIAKRVPSKKNTGSFKGLSNYITRQADDKESVPYKITNTNFYSYSSAIKEIEATQKRNTRSKKSKTYHMVVSFPKGERPGDEILSEIEEKLCTNIGLKDHQRISAAHNDTDNYHFHVAINKIHPVSFNMVEPYFDKKALVNTCAKIEKEYNLTPVCSLHERDIDQFSDKANQMHSHSSLESFESYLKEKKEIIDESLEKSSSWGEFQDALIPNGIFVKERGAGAVFTTLDGQYHVPCSRTDRSFSKKNLEKKLDYFVKTKINSTSKETYAPKGKTPKNANLWDEYNTRRHLKKSQRKELQDAKKENLANQKLRYLDTRLKIKESFGANKKLSYRAAFLDNQEAVSKIKTAHSSKVKDLNKAHPFSSWQSFLVQKSNEGDLDALNTLRRKKKYEPSRDKISADNKGDTLLTNHKYTVNKAGEVVYQFTGVTVKDNGENLAVAIKEYKEDTGMLNALLFAQEKYGDVLTVDGDSTFKTKAVEVAVEAGLSIRFNDPDMEASRKALAELKEKSQSSKENQDQPPDVQSFIDKRNETRKKVSSISLHRKFKASDDGKVTYSGTRKLENCSVALYEKGGEILVSPLNKTQQKLLSKLKVGTQLIVAKSDIKVDENKGREI